MPSYIRIASLAVRVLRLSEGVRGLRRVLAPRTLVVRALHDWRSLCLVGRAHAVGSGRRVGVHARRILAAIVISGSLGFIGELSAVVEHDGASG